MSYWSYTRGVVVVEVLSGNQPWKEYLVKDVLTNLPDVNPGHGRYISEGGLDIFINQSTSTNGSSSHDENGVWGNAPGFNIVNKNRFARNSHYPPWTKVIESNDTFIITLYGNFRDTLFEDLLKRINHWLCQLGKKLWIKEISIQVSGDSIRNQEYKERIYTIDNAEAYNALWDSETSPDGWKLKKEAEIEREIIEKEISISEEDEKE